MKKTNLVLPVILVLSSFQVHAQPLTPEQAAAANRHIIAVYDEENKDAESIFEHLTVEAQDVAGSQVKTFSTSSGLVNIICTAEPGLLLGAHHECLIQYDLNKRDQNTKASHYKGGFQNFHRNHVTFVELKLSLNPQEAQEICTAFSHNATNDDIRYISRPGRQLQKLVVTCNDASGTAVAGSVISTVSEVTIERKNTVVRDLAKVFAISSAIGGAFFLGAAYLYH